MQLASCFGYFSLRGGSFFAGLVGMMVGLTMAEMGISYLIESGMHPEVLHVGYVVPSMITLYALGLSISSVTALIGIQKDRPQWLIAFFIFLGLNVIIMISVLIYVSVEAGFIAALFFVVLNSVAAHIYFALVVYSFAFKLHRYQNLESADSQNSPDV